jgi:RHS repeat-associated protein
VTKIDYPAEGGSAGFSVITVYDDFGRVQSSTDYTGTTMLHWDALDRPTQIAPPAPQKTIDFGYVPDSTTYKRWTTTLTVSGIGAYQYSEDTKGRLFLLTNPFSQVFQLEYDKDGKNTLAIWPNGVKEERTYTTRDWLASLLTRMANGTPKDTFNYYYYSTNVNTDYDPTGHLRREVDMGGRTHAFSYNKLYELTQETHPDLAIGTIDYTYNKNGDRLTRKQNGVTDYYGVAGDNRLIWVNRVGSVAPTPGQPDPYTILGYNANGQVNYRDRRFTTGGLRQELDFFWDGDDRLRSVKQHAGGATYFSASYNGDGVRINKTDTRGALGLQVHNYSYGPLGLLHEDNPTTIYTPGFGHRSNGINSFYHVDWLGSTRYTSDSSGNTFPQGLRYDAYGNRSATLDPNNWHPTDEQWAGLWGYQTEWASATDPGLGLDYLQQRYYDPAVGRFLSPDPLGFLGGTNLYGYVENDPVSGVDPSGLGDPEEDFEAALQRRETQRVQVNQLQRQVHTGLRTAIDVGSSFEPVSNFMMAVNDAGERKWWSAALRLSGPLLKLAGRVGRFCRPQMRPGFARLPFGPLKIVSRDPNTIRFSQDNIKAAFRNVQFGTVDSLVQKLKSGLVKPEEIEPIRLVEREGHLITIDNRRLYAFREAGVPIRTRMATAREIREAIRQGKFSAGPLGSPTIRVRGR